MRIAVLTLDAAGGEVAGEIAAWLPDTVELRSGRDGALPNLFLRAFAGYEGLVCVMACGIAVRMAGPLAKSKFSDPAVVVVDGAARFAISLLSGHEGGANRLAYEVAAATGAEPVVTTGTDTKRLATIGIGCRKGVSIDEVKSAVTAATSEAGLKISDLRHGASIRLKRGEAGLVGAFRELGIPLLFIPEDEINRYDGPYVPSGAAERNIGVRAVAEPCALLAGRRARLVFPKRIYGPVTVAVAIEDGGVDDQEEMALESVIEPTREPVVEPAIGEWKHPLLSGMLGTGSLAIVGIGPGGLDHITRAAEKALGSADFIVGYGFYLDLIAPLIVGKERFVSSMRAEAERAEYALDAARKGRRVAVVASGDACVYGIGGLALERLRDDDAFPVTVVPGITAANSAASLVGSPLANDYMVVSLSDIMTDRETILRRVRAAVDSDIAIALYNPKSRSRGELLDESLRLLLDARGPGTPVGIVRNALRPDQASRVCALCEVNRHLGEIDMFTVVIVASSRSTIRHDRILTPRGYGAAGNQKGNV